MASSKPTISKPTKPYSVRPASMMNPGQSYTPSTAEITSKTNERRRSNHKQLSTQSEYGGSEENVNPIKTHHSNYAGGSDQQQQRLRMQKQQPNHKQHSIPDKVSGVQLSNLVDATKNFPIAACVETGMYGQISESSLYQERIIIHFEMRLKVIEATVEKGGTYQIPLCTTNKFSLLHNPTDNFGQSIMGHYYESVGHILAQPRKPKVVCATRSHNSTTTESSVHEGDILFLSPNIRTKAFKSGKFLKCYNVVTNEEKLLHESCIGGFTTQPERIRMSLKDIWDSKYTNPPLKVIMFHQLPNVVLAKHIQATLLSEKWEDSVLATRDHVSAQKNESVYGNVQLLRLTKDVGIGLVADKEEDFDPIVYKAYCEETCHLFNEFDYSRIQQHLFNEDPVWPNYEEIQSSFYSSITRTDWEHYVLLKKPENAFKSIKRRRSIKNYAQVSKIEEPETAKLQITDGQGDYDVLKPVTKEDLNDLIGVRMEDQPAVSDVATLLHEVNTVNRQMMIQVDSLRAEVEGLKMELKQTKNMMLTLKRDLTSSIGGLKTELSILAAHHDDYVPMEPNGEKLEITSESENIQVLKSLNSNQVLLILDKLNLVRCKAVFEEKCITGADLAECNVQTLENVLGVDSQLDIIRLMKLVQGCPVMWKLLENPVS